MQTAAPVSYTHLDGYKRQAYRNIRKNSGSRTAGVDNKTISDLNKWNENALVAHVQRKLDWYIPNAVRRVEIPKDNGKTRPLGIPTIMDLSLIHILA